MRSTLGKHRQEPTPPQSVLKRRLAAWAAQVPVQELGLKERTALQVASGLISAAPDDALERILVTVHRELTSMLTEHFQETDAANARR